MPVVVSDMLKFLPVIAGYLFTYYHTKVSEERKARLERVNEQLRDLHGPLLACVTASKAAYDAMIHHHSSDGTRARLARAIQRDPDGEVGQAYRKWMRDVLQPLNEKAAEIIISYIDLLDSHEIEPALLQLVAHTAAYRVVLARWDEGATSAWSSITYPDQLLQWLQRELARLKQRQAELLGNGALLRSKL